MSKLLFGLFLLSLIITSPKSTLAYTTNMSASVVLGQPNFTSNNPYGGESGPSNKNFFYPWGICVYDGKLIVSDRNLNRILIWNSIPTQNNTPADVVLGQPDFNSGTANNGGVSGNSLSESIGLNCTNGKILIADELNHRVLIWNAIPTVSGTPADVVIGQPNLNSNLENNGGIGPNTLRKPRSVWFDGTRVFVSDGDNHRVLIWNSFPTSSGVPADVVLGQTDFNSYAREVSQRGLNRPFGVHSDGTKLYVGDFMAHRIMIWNQIPTQNHAPADVVIGQNNFVSDLPNQGGTVGSNTIAPNPFGMFRDPSGRLFIPDRGSNRILIFNSVPTQNGASADVVLGQPDFTSSTINQSGKGYFEGGSVECCPNANTLYGARYIYAYQDKLFVADADNHRVLIFNNTPPDLSSGLVAYWKFDEGVGTTTLDFSNNLTAYLYTSTWGDGLFNKALSFNGTDSFAYLPVNLHEEGQTNTIHPSSLSLWFNPKTDLRTTAQGILSSDRNDNCGSLRIESTGNNRLYFSQRCYGFPYIDISSDNWTNQWVHLVLTINSSGQKIYINGVERTLHDIDSQNINWVLTHLGRRNSGSMESALYFNGLIDEVRIYNRVLTYTEIQQLYNNR